MLRVLALLAVAFAAAGALADDMDERVQAAQELGSTREILEALEREAYRGNLKATHELGMNHLEGHDVPRDAAKAASWFERAAERDLIRQRYKLGYPESQYQLGLIHESGNVADHDPEEAAEWYHRAADQGHAPAQLALARLYADDASPPRGYDKALFWGLIAASSFDISAPQRAAARKIVELSRGKLSPGAVKDLTREAAAWSPALFAD